jgi:hypothetical protein
MANIIIKADDPRIAEAISEGANAVELRTVKAECARLNALNGVRSYGDSVRYETACKALAVKYANKPMGWLHEVILTAWACIWYGLYTLVEYLTKEV